MMSVKEIKDHMNSLPEYISHGHFDNVDDAYMCGYYDALKMVLIKRDDV